MSKLDELKKQEKELVEKLKKKRLEIGEADNAMQSRFPTGRFELEEGIQILEIHLERIRKEIEKLQARN